MQSGRRYPLKATLTWSKPYIIRFLIFDAVVILLFLIFRWEWMAIPWQPISLIGIAVAFYLGFKNNAAYDRLWEGRKIWGGIVNASRSFTVMARDFVNNDEANEKLDDAGLAAITKKIVHRHVAWLHVLAMELRKVKPWEHSSAYENEFRKNAGTHYDDTKLEDVREYLSEEDYNYILTKGNRSSHLLSLQSKHMIKLRQAGIIEHFRHLEMQGLITEFYTLQGKSERIKNFPFPRQYASINFFFVMLFIGLLPFGMISVFNALEADFWLILAIPFSVVASWVFWMMEMIGDYSENPFEGLHNDVPIASMARGIEIDIRQMLDETDLPDKRAPYGALEISV